MPTGTTFHMFDGTLMGTVSSDYFNGPLIASALSFTIDPDFLSTLNLNNCTDSSSSDGPGCIWYRLAKAQLHHHLNSL